jgi:predicted transcriptional regulator
LAEFEKEELDLTASEMTLRALQAATEALNYKILQALASQPALSMKELTAAVNQERLILSERLNDLIQVGLSNRLIDTDQVQITAAGASLVLLIQEIAEQVAKEYYSQNN